MNSDNKSGNDDPLDIKLRIRPDPFCESDGRSHFQWFYFRAAGLQPGTTQIYRLTNAKDASYAPAWDGYHAAASFDREHWFRIQTTEYNEKGELVISHHIPSHCRHNTCYYAYFPPYSYERHLDLIAKCAASPLVRSYSLGQTLDRREIDCLEVTDASVPAEGKRALWVIARQHPGESMAEWLVEGMLERLLNPSDPISRALLRQAVVYVVPNVCPDGAIRGHLRTNASGANLNREWATPSVERSPEAFYILKKMDETGVDFLLDVHGDEELPYNFIAGLNGIPAWGPRLERLQTMFVDSLKRLSPDFQDKYGYPTDAPGKANLKLCSKAIGQKFDCLSLTFEQPFKGTANNPMPGIDWTPERAKVLGATILQTMHEVAPYLRD